MWVVKDLEVGSLIYRDYLANITEKELRSARLSVWFKTPERFFLEENERFKIIVRLEKEELEKKALALPTSPADATEAIKDKLKVYTDMDLITKYLTSKHFEVVEKPEDADLIWVTMDVFAQFSKKHPIK